MLLSKQPVKVAYLFQFAITGWFKDTENKRMGLNFSNSAVSGLIKAIISKKVLEHLCMASETEHQYFCGSLFVYAKLYAAWNVWVYNSPQDNHKDKA